MEYFIWSINPNIVEIGSIKVHWYGLFFISSFLIGQIFMGWVFKREGRDDSLVNLYILYMMIGTLVGARLAHCFFYDPSYYIANPVEILHIGKGGLASHGGMMGVILATYIFSLRYKFSFFWLLARLSIPGTLCAIFVRFGNFFNSEILGLPTELPWAVIFSNVDMIPRHPVQLYEALAYFILLIILFTVYKKSTPTFATKVLPGIFFLIMFTSRFLIEYFKTKQSTYVLDVPFTTGQLLSIPFIILGLIWLIWALKSSK